MYFLCVHCRAIMISKGESEETGSEKEGDGHPIKADPRELMKPVKMTPAAKRKRGFLIYSSVST